MLDELMRSLEQDHLHQEGKIVVEVMTKSIKPESLKRAIQSVEERRLPLRVAGKVEAINAQDRRATYQEGCLKCGEMSHRVARFRLAKPKRYWQAFSRTPVTCLGGTATKQVPSADLDLPLEDLRHQPVAFISGSLSGASAADLSSRRRAMQWSSHARDSTTWSYALVYIFNPSGTNAKMAKYLADKL
ncbi:hypothetical protein H257_05194 [Aphanomyces astaci]|uniref:Uncharacterized protein n=1 Tax=Aphanomyces astaci TaxID=112090 RepID=W4GTI8_APHAT|nr:hypothetical protein H257_05194 [Aphanomyces astaci]ETV82616.1 hypothetical protein H257_05194 [Aphanomyces astaci]|eukprot:XP_009828285.1 hypothetical protein H257_05194 [Aphanomyces astaci]